MVLAHRGKAQYGYTLRSARADQAMEIDENTGDFDASIRWNRNCGA